MEYWTGILDYWNGILDYWNDLLHSVCQTVYRNTTRITWLHASYQRTARTHYQLLGQPLLCPCPYLICRELVHMMSGSSIEAQEGLEKLGKGLGQGRAGIVAANRFSPCAGMTHSTVLAWQCFYTVRFALHSPECRRSFQYSIPVVQ